MRPNRFTYTRRSFAMLLALALILPLTLTLSGCSRDYTRSDIEKYVRKELGIKEFTVASEPIQKDPDHANYKYWEVTTDWYGLDKPITFDVVEYSAIDVTLARKHSLHGDASDAIREAIARMYHSDGKLTVSQVKNDDGELVDEWSYPVSSRTDFEDSWSEIQKFQAFLKKYPRIGAVYFLIYYHVKNLDETGWYGDTFYDTYPISIESGTTHDNFLDQLYGKDEEGLNSGPVDLYLKDSLQFGVRSRIEEFSDAEIARVVELAGLTPVREYDSEKVFDPTVVYLEGGSAASPFVAYGNVFELARAVDLQVEGTWAEFVIHGADGQDHAFSYAKAARNGSPALSVEEAEQVLGISIDTLEETVDRTVTAQTLAYVGVTPQEFTSQLEANSNGLKISATIVDGDVQVHAKKSALDSVVSAYKEEADELSKQIDQTSQTHFSYVTESNGLILRVYAEGEWTGDNVGCAERIVKLMYMRQELLEPSTTPFVVSIQRRNGARAEDFTEIVTFNVPEDELDFSSIWNQ